MLADVRVALADQIARLQEQQSTTATLIARFRELRQRIDDLDPRPPLAAPPSLTLDSKPLQTIDPAMDDVLVETQPAGQVPLWRRPPLTHSGAIGVLIALFQQSGSAARLVTLCRPASVVVLRRYLPRGVAVQPDGDGANATTVLLYQYRGAPPGHRHLRVPYRLVDLLSLLSPDRRLTPHLHQALDLQLQQQRLPLEQGLEEHVVARARWRRTVPVIIDELEGLLSQTSPADRSQLAHLLVQVSGEDPRTGTCLPEVLRWFRLPVPDEAWVQGLITRASPEPFVHTPSAPRTPVLVPAARGAGDLDMERIAATRASTILAQQELQDLDEYPEDDHQHPSGERVEPRAVADDDPLHGALGQLARRLSAQERHELTDIRDLATQLGMVPLDAIRRINEWVQSLPAQSDDPPDALIEVDEANDAVWVEPLLKELLR